MATRKKAAGPIWTITPNPALDLGGIADQIVPNEKSYVYDETRFPGGNGINAARVIRQMKVPVLATGFIGGCAGLEILQLLDAMKVKHDFVMIRGASRINVTVSSLETHKQTRLSFPGPRIRPAELQALNRKVRDANGARQPSMLILGGSFPPGFETRHAIQLLRAARSREIPCIIDVPSKTLKDLLPERPYMIKPNLSEFRELIGSPSISSIPDVIRAARELNEQVPLVCVSSVDKGALLVTRDAAFYGKGPRVTVRSTVGAGDSMVGAIAASLVRSASGRGGAPLLPYPSESVLGEALRYGLAAAVSTLTTTGTDLATAAQIRGHLPKVTVERLE